MESDSERSALDLSALLFHAALEEQFPDLMNYAARNERAAAEVQDLLWELTVTPIGGSLEPGEELAAFARHTGLHRFVQRVVEGDRHAKATSYRGWSGVPFVGSAAAFMNRMRLMRSGQVGQNPSVLREKLLPVMSQYIDEIEERLRQASQQKRTKVSDEPQRRKLIHQLVSFNSEVEKKQREQLINDLLAVLSASDEGAGIEIVQESEWHIEIVDSKHNSDEWLIVIPQSISFESTIHFAGRCIEIVGPGSYSDDGRDREQLFQAITCVAGIQPGQLEWNARLAHVGRWAKGELEKSRAYSALDLETLCSLVELSLVSLVPVTEKRESVEVAIKDWGQALEVYAKHLDPGMREHRAHLIRHFSFVAGFLRRVQRANPRTGPEQDKEGRRDTEWLEWARRALDAYKMYPHYRSVEKQQVAVDYYTALHEVYTGVGAEHPPVWFEIAKRAYGLGMTETAAMAGAIGDTLSLNAGMGPSQDQADRPAALLDPFVVVGLRKRLWSIQSLRAAPSKERNRTFLSYRRADSYSIVERIKDQHPSNQKFWLDVDELQLDRDDERPDAVGSKDWRLGLLSSLYDCDRVVLCFSMGYFRSAACLNELRSAALGLLSRSMRLTWLAVDGAAMGRGEEQHVSRSYSVEEMRNLVRTWAKLGLREVDMEMVETVLKCMPAVRHVVSPFLEDDCSNAAEQIRIWQVYGTPAFD